ncbi:MAG TPA: hypothetical protein ENK57_20645 [Polyangiaceae bacterium]|nr:hypothetical protein [Polyangiaceae bacterium]
MTGAWYPSLREQLDAERQLLERSADVDIDDDLELQLLELAADGNVDALMALREHVPPIDYDELGWGD